LGFFEVKLVKMPNFGEKYQLLIHNRRGGHYPPEIQQIGNVQQNGQCNKIDNIQKIGNTQFA